MMHDVPHGKLQVVLFLPSRGVALPSEHVPAIP